MTAGGCRGRSLQRCSSGGMASFPPASRGSMSPGRGRVGALRASWRAGWWILVDLFGFFSDWLGCGLWGRVEALRQSWSSNCGVG
jgi:hypothetical protein